MLKPSGIPATAPDVVDVVDVVAVGVVVAVGTGVEAAAGVPAAKTVTVPDAASLPASPHAAVSMQTPITAAKRALPTNGIMRFPLEERS